MPVRRTPVRAVLALLGAALALLTAGGCDDDPRPAPAPGTGGGEIVVLLPEGDSMARWERDDRRFLTDALEQSEPSYSIVNAEGDARQMRIQAEQAIAGGAKVLIMAHVEPAAGRAIIENARRSEVTVIDYDRLTPGAERADFYVGPRPGAVGQLLGRGLVDAVADAGLTAPAVAILTRPDAAAGYDAVLDPLVASEGWTRLPIAPVMEGQRPRRRFERAYDAASGIDAVLATDDALAGAVVATLDERGASPVPLTGAGASVAALRNILAGEQSMSAYTPVPEQAQAAVALAVAIVDGEPTTPLAPERVGAGRAAVPAAVVEPVAVTVENIAEVVIADGLRTWAEICAGEAEALCPPEDER